MKRTYDIVKSNMRKFDNVTAKTKRTMSHIKRKNTSIEIVLRKALWKKGIRYRTYYKSLPGTPDIVLTKYKIAIFCDSEFFHGKDWEVLRVKLEHGNNSNYWVAKIEENIKRDQEVDKQLSFLGWSVIHFWGKDILKRTDECVQAVEEAIFDKGFNEGDEFCDT